MPEKLPIQAIIIFLAFVGFTLGLSFWLGRKAKTAGGYFAAHGQVGWFVNGLAFAGDYLSAASFLGICGMIAFYGYDGFLYSIGFLAGWVVALFVIAEPIKKLGKYTFADALSSRFGDSKGITLAAAISTLVVSVFYLIPQMVGAGALLKALLKLPDKPWFIFADFNHAIGVIIVGVVVILIVVTAGMVSTTWVQFIKGSLLVVFCAVLVVAILARGVPKYTSTEKPVAVALSDKKTLSALGIPPDAIPQSVSVGPAEYIAQISESTIVRSVPAGSHPQAKTMYANEDPKTLVPLERKGSELLLPGGYFKGIKSTNIWERLDFVSLMLALFCGTASLPHILIRYYTVKNASAARKSTVVGIGAIGFFYILTLFIGLGAMVSGHLEADSNMAAPLLAESFNEWAFAFITAIAFTTVLGTVSGLILAGAGAIAHDLIETVIGHKNSEHAKVGAAKWASLGIGVVAIMLGILAKDFNVGFLVGWAFNIAASANLPAIVMLLFWKRTTKEGMIASILTGTFASVLWLMLTKEAFANFYQMKDHPGIMPFSQPGLVTIPLAFAVLIVVSLITKSRAGAQRGVEVVK